MVCTIKNLNGLGYSNTPRGISTLAAIPPAYYGAEGVCPDPDSPTKDRVYVGEGDNVLTRLVKHEGDESKDYWTRSVVSSKDENLTKAHVR